jgi:acyl dehydratase
MRVFKSIDEMAAAVGEELGVSDWLTIDQARVNTFADATGDHQWIHVDVERARRELPSKGTIAHGFLTLSLIPMLAAGLTRCDAISRGINYGLNKVRFTNMVPTGARVRLRAKLIGAEKRAGGTQFTHEYTIEIEGEERPACVAEMITISYP